MPLAFVGVVCAPSLVASPFPRERGAGEGSFKTISACSLKTPHLTPLPLPKRRGGNTQHHNSSRSSRPYRDVPLSKTHTKGKLRRAAGQARLRRSTEFLLSPKIANV